MSHGGDRARDNLVDALAQYIDEHGYSPTVRELAETVGLSPSAVHMHLEVLRGRGAVTGGHSPRTLRPA